MVERTPSRLKGGLKREFDWRILFPTRQGVDDFNFGRLRCTTPRNMSVNPVRNLGRVTSSDSMG